MQCASALLPPVTCPVLQHVSTLSHKWHDCRKKSHWTQNIFWSSLHLLSETFLVLRRTPRGMIKNLYLYSYKVPLMLVRFYWNLLFFNRFPKYTHFQWETSFFHADRLMHMTKLMIIFRNFAKESKSIKQINCSSTKHNFEFSKCTVAANVFQNILKTTKRNSL
jgi:hypothetical protein